ncbi:MAG: hypothetical protein WDA00_06960 [Eubacteriales bacterium]
MKVSKKFLYSGIAILLIAAAAFFALYGAYGNRFNYAKKDMGKYLTIPVALYLEADISEAVLEIAQEKDVRAYIAAYLKDYLAEDDSKLIAVSEYDMVLVNLYGTYVDDDDKVVIFTHGSMMDPAKPIEVQVGSDDGLAEIFGDALLGLLPTQFSYHTVSSGQVEADDILYLSYLKSGTGEKEVELVQVKTDGSADEVYGEGFTEYIQTLTIGGNAGQGTFGETTYESIKLKWAARTVVKAGNYESGDIAYITATTKNASGQTVSFTARVTDDGASGADLPAFLFDMVRDGMEIDKAIDAHDYERETGLTAFVSGIKYYTLEDGEYTLVDTTVVTTPELGVDYYVLNRTYAVTINYVLREGMTGEGEGEQAGIRFHEFTYTYPEETTATHGYDKDISLANREVTFYLCPISVYDAEYTVDTLLTDTDFTAAAAKGEVFKKLQADFEALQEALEALEEIDEDQADLVEAYLEALVAYKAAKAAFEAEENEDTTSALADANAARAAAEEALTALDDEEGKYADAIDELADAYDALAAKVNDYDEEAYLHALLGEEDFDTEVFAAWLDGKVKAAYALHAEEKVNEEMEIDYRIEVAGIVWNNLIEALGGSEAVTLPKKAVKLAYSDLLDSHKATYYEKFQDFSEDGMRTFRQYMKKTVGADYKEKLTAQAEEIVYEKLVLYYLAQELDITITDEQVKQAFNNYYTYYQMGYLKTFPSSEQVVADALYFDTVMQKLLNETYCPELAPEAPANQD